MKGTRTAWIAGPSLVALWAVAGFFFDSSTHLSWLPKWSLAAVVLIPLAFIALYTAQGLAGPGKWWRTDVGTNLVWLLIAVVFGHGLIAWAVFFHGGLINTPGMAWAYIGSLLAETLIVIWRSVIWLRAFHREPPILARLRELEAENMTLRERLRET